MTKTAAPLEPLTAEQLARSEKGMRERTETNGGGGNLVRYFNDNLAGEIAAKKQERAEAVARVRKLSEEIARLEAHELVGAPDAEPVAPVPA